ncbi:TPR repeat-containing protein (plasmid) [Azospirillum sp. B510]|uniref:tetratricopeptide repeat protein n=1 Tax=Azospirillum sp. (strain B510) TaxID=137722 RepID=UPI0001C4B905|nr:tetratricopeptide repeat protein [Azospirillum sp. B510]BAI74179.1 TPR repeat-containing protein [Azospirillum sp. B510]
MTVSDALLAEAFDHHQTGGFAEAEGLYRRLLAIEPARADGLHRFGLLTAQLGRLEEADRLLSRALALAPADAEAAVNHAKILRALQKPGAAAGRFRRALAMIPDLLTAFEGLGHAEREGGNLAAAAGAYGRAARLGAGAPVLHQWGIALESIGDMDKAAEALRRSAHLAPAMPSVALRLAGILQRLGRHSEAAGWYRHALVLHPGHGEIRRSLTGITTLSNRREPTA